MLIGQRYHNTNQIAALESLDAVVVVDEMDAGIRYAWGQVDTHLPPMEALARYYVLGLRSTSTPGIQTGDSSSSARSPEQYKVDGIVSESCASAPITAGTSSISRSRWRNAASPSWSWTWSTARPRAGR